MGRPLSLPHTRVALGVLLVGLLACGGSPTAPSDPLTGTWVAVQGSTALTWDSQWPFTVTLTQNGQAASGQWTDAQINGDVLQGTASGTLDGSTWAFSLSGNIGSSSSFPHDVGACPFSADGTATVAGATMTGSFTEANAPCWDAVSGPFTLQRQ